jgi:hypothetical protein
VGGCLSLQFLLDFVLAEIPALVPQIDPWLPDQGEPEPPVPPFVDPSPLLDIALGGALLALRAEFPMPSVDVREAVDDRGDELLQNGAAAALCLGMQSFATTLERHAKLPAEARRQRADGAAAAPRLARRRRR